MIIGNVDVFVISETILDESFPKGQFKIPGYTTPFLVDCDRNGGGIIVFLREDIPVRYLSTEDKPVEAFFFKLNLHKKKLLMSCSFKPHRNNIARHLESLRRSLDLY